MRHNGHVDRLRRLDALSKKWAGRQRFSPLGGRALLGAATALWILAQAGIAVAEPAAAGIAAGGATAPADWEKLASPKADKIVVFKSLRKMELRRGATVLRTYHIALGRQPLGQKIAEGDGRTPEGSYFIDRRNDQSDYHLALHVSYPDDDDLRRASAHGVSPGGSIMIHGEPSYLTPTERKQLLKDWTAGCIALTNPEIDEVWRMVDDGSEVDIYP